MPDLDELTCRRRTCDRKTPKKIDPSASTTINRVEIIISQPISVMLTMIYLVTSGSLHVPPSYSTMCSKAVYHTHLINQHFDGTLNYILPIAYSTDIVDNETYTFNQMLQQPYKNDFILAMMKEIIYHENRSHWHLFARSKIPQGHKKILGIWSFKRKRFLDGRINKHKSRLCAHGVIQQRGCIIGRHTHLSSIRYVLELFSSFQWCTNITQNL